jgi:hypothetical protein
MDSQASVAIGPSAITLAPDISGVPGFAADDIVARAGMTVSTPVGHS